MSKLSKAKRKKMSKDEFNKKAFFVAKRLGIPASLVAKCKLDEKELWHIRGKIKFILEKKIHVNENLLCSSLKNVKLELFRLGIQTKYPGAVSEYLLMCIREGKIVYLDYD